MSLELLRANIEKEKTLVKGINEESIKLEALIVEEEGADVEKNKTRIGGLIDGEVEQIKVLNDALPDLISNLDFYKKLGLPAAKEKPKLLKIDYKEGKGTTQAAIKKKDQMKFLKAATKVGVAKKAGKALEVKGEEKPTANAYLRFSNKYFRKFSERLIAKKLFDKTNRNLRMITSPILLHSYVSMLLMSTVLAFIVGLVIGLPFFFFGIVLIPLSVISGLPLLTFLLFYAYPGSQRKTLEKQINQELPFVTIYMSAVATSGIEPTKIFDILVRTKDYPSTNREIKKLLNYINFYGYDIVTALRYGSKQSPSERLSLLFNGLATTITTGGELSGFLKKHSEGLLFDYRLEREKYTKVAETFMDIYISIVIAAPMILMILFVLISLTGYASGFLTPNILSILVIFMISVLNIGFLLFLNFKQPKF